MKQLEREYPQFSLCGLNCSLCPRHYGTGSSVCPGCCGPGFSETHPSCGIISCNAKRSQAEFCFQCPDFPCSRYKDMPKHDSFITYANVLSDMQKAKHEGIEKYIRELEHKTGILRFLLEQCNDGRKKSFYCLSVNLLPLDELTSIHEHLKQIEPEQRVSTAVRLLREAAERNTIELTLRKKP